MGGDESRFCPTSYWPGYAYALWQMYPILIAFLALNRVLSSYSLHRYPSIYVYSAVLPPPPKSPYLDKIKLVRSSSR